MCNNVELWVGMRQRKEVQGKKRRVSIRKVGVGGESRFLKNISSVFRKDQIIE